MHLQRTERQMRNHLLVRELVALGALDDTCIAAAPADGTSNAFILANLQQSRQQCCSGAQTEQLGSVADLNMEAQAN